MSERERWIVYPLLFLALGASLRDKLGGRLTAKSIVCQELVIEDEPIGNQPPTPVAVLHRVRPNPNSPAIAALRINGQVEVEGAVKVDGVVNVSKYYAIQGVPIIPELRVVPRDVSPVRPAPGKAPSATTPDSESTPRSDDSSKNPPPADKSVDEAPPQN